MSVSYFKAEDGDGPGIGWQNEPGNIRIIFFASSKPFPTPGGAKYGVYDWKKKNEHPSSKPETCVGAMFSPQKTFYPQCALGRWFCFTLPFGRYDRLRLIFTIELRVKNVKRVFNLSHTDTHTHTHRSPNACANVCCGHKFCGQQTNNVIVGRLTMCLYLAMADGCMLVEPFYRKHRLLSGIIAGLWGKISTFVDVIE